MAGGGHGGGGGMRWLLTYADLITLLMVFFVVLFAMANVDKQKYQALAHSLTEAIGVDPGLGTGPGGPGVSELPSDLAQLAPSEPAPVRLPPDPAAPPVADDRLRAVGQSLAVDLQPYGRFHVYVSDRGVVISLLGSALFDSGAAEIRAEARPVLDVIAGRLKGLDNDISVEGSADDRPIATAEFPSNWELSIRRATEVVHYMTDRSGLDPARLIAVGYAEQRPVFANDTPAGRAGNRRVDIVILRQPHDVRLGEEIMP